MGPFGVVVGEGVGVKDAFVCGVGEFELGFGGEGEEEVEEDKGLDEDVAAEGEVGYLEGRELEGGIVLWGGARRRGTYLQFEKVATGQVFGVEGA